MNKEIKKSIIKMYEPLKEQDLVYYDELQKIIDYIWELEHRIDKAIEYIQEKRQKQESEILVEYEAETLEDILKGEDNE